MKKFILISFLFSTQFLLTGQSALKIETIGKGPDLILIPGLGCPGSVWLETVDQLKENYTCHMVTLPGFGEHPPIDFTNGYLPEVKAQLITLIEKRFETPPVVIGHSLGGFLSMDLASTHPELIQKIIVVDSYPFYSAAINPYATAENMKPQAKQLKGSLVNTPDSLFIQQQMQAMQIMATKQTDIATIVRWSTQSDRQTIAQAMYEIMTTDLRNQVSGIACPVLVLGSWYAAKDYGVTLEQVKNNFKMQLSNVANCTIKMAPTAKHFIMLDEPSWFIEQVKDFL